MILSAKTLEHLSVGKRDKEQTAAPEVMDDASLPFPSAEVNRQPGVLMLTKPHWQMHNAKKMICTYEAAAARMVTNCIADNLALVATVLKDL